MKKGRIELAIGPMFSGKTSWLIEELGKYPSHEIIAIRSFVDTRYSTKELVTHDKKKIKAITAKGKRDILLALREKPTASILGVDEVQFFKPTITELFEKLKNKNFKILVAGLDLDHKNRIWDTTEAALKVADKINKLVAICAVCGKRNATITNRKGQRDQKIVIGGSELYEPLCMKDYLDLNNRASNTLPQ